MFDYGARFYDPVIARFTTIDPLSDEFDHLSPYNYAMNNPILMVDPDGMAADTGKKVIHLQEVSISTSKESSIALPLTRPISLPGTKILAPILPNPIFIFFALLLWPSNMNNPSSDHVPKRSFVYAKKTVEELEAESESIKIKNQKKNKFYKKKGGMDQADRDFDALGPNVTGRIPEKKGRMGTLPDGRKINVRNGSSTPGDDPTIHVTNPDGSTIKWRYEK